MATSTKHSGFKRLLDRNQTLAILVNGAEALSFRRDSTKNYGVMNVGTPYEAVASIIDGYGVSLATGYAGAGSNRTFALGINADTGSTDLTGDTYEAAIRGRTVIGTTQTNASIMGVIGCIDVGSAKNIQGNFFGLDGVLDFYANSTAGSGASFHAGAIRGTVWNEGTTTLGVNAVLSGISLYQVSGIPTLGTGAINPAVHIRASTSSRWQHGIYMEPTHIHHALKAGNQPGEALASIVDGHGVNLALDYSATRYSFGTSYRLYALEINGDTGSVNCTGDVNLGAIKGRMVAGTTQANCGISGVVGTLDVGTANLQGNFNGVCGVLDFYGNCTLGTGATCYGAGLVSVVWNEANTTLGAGAVLSGVDIVENGAIYSAGSGALNPAITIRGNWTSALNITSTGCYAVNTQTPGVATAYDIVVYLGGVVGYIPVYTDRTWAAG